MAAKLSLFIDARGRSVLHRTGFSWLAALALPLWALHRRLWLLVLASVPLTYGLHALVALLLKAVPDEPTQGGLMLVWILAWSWAAGRWANRVHRLWLERRGYIMTATELPAAGTP